MAISNKTNYFFRSLSVLLFCIILLPVAIPGMLAAAANGNDGTQSKYPVKDEGLKSFVVEEAYYYQEAAYEPPVKVIPVSREDADYSTPEDAAIAFISSMIHADYDMWLDSWSEGSRKIQLDRAKEDGRDGSFWEGIWRKRYADIEATLVRKLTSGRYVIIEAAYLKAGETKPRFDDITLKKENGKWLVTLDLASDPMKTGWENPQERKKYTKRRADDNPETVFEDSYWKMKNGSKK